MCSVTSTCVLMTDNNSNALKVKVQTRAAGCSHITEDCETHVVHYHHEENASLSFAAVKFHASVISSVP